ncbi:YibE/F family protein [Clostridium massiliodielmoense]|uniref:YibE/F family protein n=1 Tax=Clostridium massiliodielmoense TaxID=1776385 RepID=UPI0004D473FE|nr:YibE/F family protein [Clostridium massiliodielmoense]KEH92683.1 YibE/F family protein [Clostridium botulinum C/D str. BKT12695]
MKRIKRIHIFLFIIFIFSACFSVQCFAEEKSKGLSEYYSKQMEKPDYKTVKARVMDITFDDTKEDKKDTPIESDIRYQHLKIEIISGEHKGEEYTVRNTVEMISPYKLVFKKGDKMLLHLTEGDGGKVVNLKIYERSREGILYFIVILFMALLILIGGKKGLKSVITLNFMGLLIIFVLLPLIRKGYNPILVSIFISILSVIFTLTLVSGRNKKTLTAILGTIGGVVIAGIIAMIVGNIANLTGVGSEDAQMLAYIPQNKYIDFKGLLYGGIIIGALGAIMDVTMSVSSAMWEIREIKPKIKSKELIKSGMNIGKDIMGSMSNTLILAYAGGAIYIMLLFSMFKMDPLEIINLEPIASEIIRAMAGSIGLICAIPLTVVIASSLAKKDR